MDEPRINVPPLRKGTRPPEVEAELTRLYLLTDEQRRHLFQTSARTGAGCSCEALVHFCTLALAANDNRLADLTFGVLTSLTRRRMPANREDHVQEILTYAFEFIREGRADFLECSFATFAMRRSVDLLRKENRRLEYQWVRNEPTETHDPLEHVPDGRMSPECEAMRREALSKLPRRLRQPLIQRLQGRTNAEIARLYGVSPRTVHTWLKEASRILRDLDGRNDQ